MLGALASLVPIGLSIYSAVQGQRQQNKANKAFDKQNELLERDYQQGAPLRRQGMQALGQVESAYDLGNLGFDSQNPFAVARGRSPSTATIGNWDRFTTDPDQMDLALAGLRPDELDFMIDARQSNYIGRSGGKQRFSHSGTDREYTNDDRNAANALNDRFQNALGFTGVTPLQLQQRLRTPRAGMQPLGGGR